MRINENALQAIQWFLEQLNSIKTSEEPLNVGQNSKIVVRNEANNLTLGSFIWTGSEWEFETT